LEDSAKTLSKGFVHALLSLTVLRHVYKGGCVSVGVGVMFLVAVDA
jgi:hypothetical protein